MIKRTPWGTWDALQPPAFAKVLAGFERRWWFAGGYALEAFTGRSWREHDDIDVALFREDATALRAHIAAWDVHAADPPGVLRPWPEGEVLPAHVHDIWVRAHGEDEPWRFQFMLDEAQVGTDGSRAWHFRPDARITRPEATLTFEHEGARWLLPEVQLLYKARRLRAKDEWDFAEVLPALDRDQRAWLRESLALIVPGHPWLARL